MYAVLCASWNYGEKLAAWVPISWHWTAEAAFRHGGLTCSAPWWRIGLPVVWADKGGA